MIAPGPTLETARLILRPTAAEDFDGWAELMGDEDNSRHIGGPQDRAQAWRGMMSMGGAWALEGYAMFSILDRETGAWLGRAGPWVPEGWPGTEVGWALLKSAWGKGYALEAAEATIHWAFDHLGWTEVIHTIAPDNTASQRVAQRLGSTLQGPGVMPAPYAHLPVEIWGQTRAQWKARVR